jgi:hypothetical protein
MSKIDNFPDTLPEHFIDSLTEPKVHSIFSDILHILPEFSVNIAMSVALATTFIAIFFFTYVKDVERKIVLKNVNYIVDDLAEGIVPFLPKELKKQLYYNLDKIELPNMDVIDKQVVDDNHKLLIKSGKLFGISFVVLMIIAFFISKIYNLDFYELLITNILLLCAIAFTEYAFLNIVIFEWISADPNKVKSEVIKSVVFDK